MLEFRLDAFITLLRVTLIRYDCPTCNVVTCCKCSATATRVLMRFTICALHAVHCAIYTHILQHVACQNWWRCSDFAATVAVLTSHGANTQYSAAITTDSTHYQWQPVHIVAADAGHSGSATAVKLLITKHSAAVNAVTTCASARTAAWLAARYACADSNSSSSSSSASSSDDGDTTEYTLDCLKQLLQLGADLHGTGSQSLLCAAASSGNTSIAQFLFDKGLQILETDPAYLPLQCAARKGHTAMVQLLLSRGASVSARDSNGCTALRVCLEAACDNAEMFKVLLAAGGDPLDVMHDNEHNMR
jgi:Ankyrin repeats (3 copies)